VFSRSMRIMLKDFIKGSPIEKKEELNGFRRRQQTQTAHPLTCKFWMVFDHPRITGKQK
jgi:hypothetical protein